MKDRISLILSVQLVLLVVLSFFSCGQDRTKPDILLITIDTLRRDRLGCYGYSIDTSPFIDRLAGEGVLFKNVTTPLPFTAPSHATILTSLHPLTHQVLRNAAALNPGVETITEVLKKNDYYTMGAVAVKHLSGQYNFSQGFDSFSDKWDPNIKDWKVGPEHFMGNFRRVAKSVDMSLKEQIENYREKHKNKPFFIWVHYFDPHHPYIDREEIVLNVKKKKWIEYDKEVRYTDNYIKKLYRLLEEKGLTEKLITCITADHGEQLGEHGLSAYHKDFYSETTFVPLIFHGYKIPTNKVVRELVSTMDIGVTLLKLANLNYTKPTDGIPLLNLDGKPAVIPPRDQLIMGHLLYTRSLQLISFPYSYILNFDSFYKTWFFSGKIQVPENRFKPVLDKWTGVRYFDKKDQYELRLTFPYAYKFRKGLSFTALRFDIEKNNDISVGCKLNISKWSEPFYIDDKTKTATAFFPVTAMDRLTVYITFKEGAKIANLRYVFLPKEEFSAYSQSCREIESKKIFTELKTMRKFKSPDELYNLDSDIQMTKNLLRQEKQPPKITVEGKKKIYNFLDYYLGKMKKIIGESKSERDLTKKEKEMLKSLGYL